MALANITNNILTDSGILVTNLTPTTRTLTINGVTYDLSADRSWSIATHDAVTIGTANGLSLSGQVLSLGLASGSANGALSSTDWTTFNNKQNALTNPVTGTGTTNYLPKFTGTSTIGNSQIFDTGSEVRIFTTSTDARNFTLGVYGVTWDNTLLEVANDVTVFNKTSADNGSLIEFRTVGGQRGDIRATTSSFSISSRTSLIFGSNNTDNMRLDASGNLGLGSGLSFTSWSNSGNIDLNDVYLSLSSAGTYGGVIANNAYYNGGWKYKVENYATLYQTAAGQHRWLTAGVGTAAGNAISFTQAMTLDASGQLSLGITAATGNANRILHINGADSAELHLTRSNSGSSSSFGGYITFDGSNNFNLQNRTGGSVNLITGTTTALAIASTGAATFSSSVITGGNVSLEANEAYVNLFSTYSVGLNARARIRAVGAGGGSGYGGDFRVSTRATNNVWNDDAFIVDYLGRVGIGTTSPSEKLTVSGNVQLSGQLAVGVQSVSGLQFINDGTIGTIDSIPLILRTASTERMRITSGGRVIINDTVGDTLFNINTKSSTAYSATGFNGNNSGIRITNGSAGEGRYSGISFGGGGNTEAFFGVVQNSGNLADLVFQTFNGSAYGERIRIKSDGNVEINTGSIKTGEPDTGWGRAAIKIGASVSGAAFNVTRYLPVSVDGTVYYINLNSSTP